MRNELDFAAIRKLLTEGNKVLLLVRHAERTKIDNNDPTFGEGLPITENGVKMSVDFGAALKGACEEVEFRSSPLRRTCMTAEAIAEGMSIVKPEIVEDDLIGNGSAFFTDRYEVFELFRDHRFFEHMFEYLSGKPQRGFAPLENAAEAYEKYVMSLFKSRLGIYATHDVFVAAFLTGKKSYDFDIETWPRFLDAAAIIIAPDGERSYALLRSGLSNDIMGVGK